MSDTIHKQESAIQLRDVTIQDLLRQAYVDGVRADFKNMQTKRKRIKGDVKTYLQRNNADNALHRLPCFENDVYREIADMQQNLHNLRNKILLIEDFLTIVSVLFVFAVCATCLIWFL